MLLGTRSLGQAGPRKASVEPGTAGGRQSEDLGAAGTPIADAARIKSA